MRGFSTWGCQEYVRGFKGVVGQGLNTLGESEYARAGYVRAVMVESEYAREGYARAVIVKSVTSIAMSRVELQML